MGKIVCRSDEDKCFIGMGAELMYGGVRGDDPIKVFKELLEIAKE